MKTDDENVFEKDGLRYRADTALIPSCQGCAFKDVFDCDFPNMPSCVGCERLDERNIIWVLDEQNEC